MLGLHNTEIYTFGEFLMSHGFLQIMKVMLTFSVPPLLLATLILYKTRDYPLFGNKRKKKK